MKPASSQPSAKKHWIISVTCRRPARTLRTGRRPDHGPKNGATNLEAGLLNLELRHHFCVRNLALFLGSRNAHMSCYIELRIGSKERYAGTCADANAGWQSMILYIYIYTVYKLLYYYIISYILYSIYCLYIYIYIWNIMNISLVNPKRLRRRHQASGWHHHHGILQTWRKPKPLRKSSVSIRFLADF